MTPQERDQLIDALLDGDLSEADFLRLEAELHVDPAARRAYYARQKLHLMLHAASRSGVTPFATPKATSLRRPSFTATRAFALAASLAALLSISALFWQSSRSPEPAAETTASGFGVVSSQVDAVWDRPLAEGALVPAGRVHLTSGAAQLELFSGVNIVIEGESEFELLSAMEMTVHQGKVRARVPEPAIGFRLRTPAGEVVDLGTEFGVSVSEGAAEVQVLDGKVEWHPPHSPKQFLTEGQSIWQTANNAPLPTSPTTYLGIEELGKRRIESLNARLQSALGEQQKLNRDPRVLIHYTMDAQASENRRLNNHAGETLDGAIVAAAATTDRFGRPDSALDFSPTGSRVRLQVPDDHGSLTFLAWVKINSLDRRFNSLFLTDGHDLGEPHWQIMEDGRLFFSVKRFDIGTSSHPDKHIFLSPPVWTPEQSGQWIMLATVYDLERGEVAHYLNGQPVSRETIPAEYRVETVRIGAASLCNWSEPAYRKDPEFVVRNLNGSLDEFALLSAALTDSEIAQLYENGKP
ncbi:MAG: FecR domain-containing protein [Verrucomicrobiales bacterium]|nr:FecR domain-containing protein [Verrucomicrobiales bacterium]